MLGTAAGTAASIAVGSALTGQIWGVVGGGAGLAAATALGLHLGCGPIDPSGGGPEYLDDGFCKKASGQGYDIGAYDYKDGKTYIGGVASNVVEIVSGPSVYNKFGPDGDGDYGYELELTYINADGETQEGNYEIVYNEFGTKIRGAEEEFNPGSECDEPGTPTPNPDYQPIPPIPVPDPDGGPCTWNTTVVDSYINGSGSLSIKYRSCPSGCDETECREFWYHGDGTTQPAPPEPPTDDPIPPRPEPDNKPLDDIKDCACKEPPEPPEPPDPDFPVDLTAWEQEFKAVCDVDDQGKPLEVTVSSGSASKASDALIAIANNQRLIVQVLQQHLNWKTPICEPEKPELEGRFVTIHFESDQDSPSGERPLRKLFRYRTESSRSVGQLREYWREFVWNAGPYCVQHSGHSWGTPQVWASSPDEGKRVIQHAARETGFDPDQVGQWTVGGSDNSRYGMPGKMRRSLRLGDYWLTSRDGPSELPWQRADP